MAIRAWISGFLKGAGGTNLESLGVKELTRVDELDPVLQATAGAPVFIFKHSTTCPVSAAAHRQVAAYLEAAGDTAPPFYLVKVIESRPLSNEIASRLSVVHQSPQLIRVDGGEAVWNASHGGITVDSIRGVTA